MCLIIQKAYELWASLDIVDSVDKGMDLIIQNPAGYGAGLDWILKFVKRVWIKIDSLQTRPIARSNFPFIICLQHYLGADDGSSS